MPDVLTDFRTESLVWVSERRLMVRVSGLKRVLSDAYIGLGRACCSLMLLWLGRSRLILSNNRQEGNELVHGNCKL